MVIRTVKNMLMAAIKEIYSVYMYPIPRHIPGGYINCAIYITRTSPFRHSASRKTLNGLATSFNAIYAGYFRVYRGRRRLVPVRRELARLLSEIAVPRRKRRKSRKCNYILPGMQQINGSTTCNVTTGSKSRKKIQIKDPI